VFSSQGAETLPTDPLATPNFGRGRYILHPVAVQIFPTDGNTSSAPLHDKYHGVLRSSLSVFPPFPLTGSVKRGNQATTPADFFEIVIILNHVIE
jgi:hypothetical protein